MEATPLQSASDAMVATRARARTMDERRGFPNGYFPRHRIDIEYSLVDTHSEFRWQNVFGVLFRRVRPNGEIPRTLNHRELIVTASSYLWVSPCHHGAFGLKRDASCGSQWHCSIRAFFATDTLCPFFTSASTLPRSDV